MDRRPGNPLWDALREHRAAAARARARYDAALAAAAVDLYRLPEPNRARAYSSVAGLLDATGHRRWRGGRVTPAAVGAWVRAAVAEAERRARRHTILAPFPDGYVEERRRLEGDCPSWPTPPTP